MLHPLIDRIVNADSPDELFNALNEQAGPLHLCSAWNTKPQLPANPDEVLKTFDQAQADQLVILHGDVSAQYWRDYKFAVKEYGLSRMNRLARSGPAPFTFSEARRLLNPVGHDQWIWNVLQDHRVRDGFITRHENWVVTYWTSHPLNESNFKHETRFVLNLSAAVAAHRLNQLVPNKKNHSVKLTPRELAVLEHLSHGLRLAAIAKRMELDVETVRVYLKRARKKLNAETSTEAAVIAVRKKMI